MSPKPKSLKASPRPKKSIATDHDKRGPATYYTQNPNSNGPGSGS